MQQNNLILDCDTGEDDALAILLALAAKLPLKAVIACFGNSTVANTAQNSADILHYIGCTDVPVIQGAAQSIQPHLHASDGVSAIEFVGANGLCNVTLPRNSSVTLGRPADYTAHLVSLLRELAPVRYVVTGPCSNIAGVCRALGEEVRELISEVFIMGAALWSPGNTGPINPATGKSFAEFNFYCDPFAARAVLESKLPIKLVTWDTTQYLTISEERFRTLRSGGRAADFILDLMAHFFESAGRTLGRPFELNDPITVLAALGYGHFERHSIDIITSGTEFGRTIETEHGTAVDVFTADPQEQERLISSVLKILGVLELGS